MCRFVPFDEKLWHVPDQDAYEVMFRFELTPKEHVDQPDEARHMEVRTVRLKVAGSAIYDGGIPSNKGDAKRVLFWHARKTLEQGEDTLFIDAQYAEDHYVDPSRIAFPPKGPFPISLTPKMGFQT